MPDLTSARLKDRLTIEQAAEHLSVSVTTLYSWRTRRRGPRAMRLGRRLYYLRDDLDAYLRAQFSDGSQARRSA